MQITTCTLTRRSRALSRDSQAAHRTLKHDIRGRFLWALPEPRTLVVQHEEAVHWPDVMPGVVARTHTTDVSTPPTGVPIQWALIANPTKSVSRGEGVRGKRIPLPPEEWKAWVARKLNGAINLHAVDATLMSVARGQKPDRMTFHRRVLYTGTGTVANRAALARLQHDGVGPGKAYGCGLLIVQEATK